MKGIKMSAKHKQEQINKNIHKCAENILYELWFTVAEKIFKRVTEVVELTEEQVVALKGIALRPNDFHIQIDEEGRE
jgi:hypothetical protein